MKAVDYNRRNVGIVLLIGESTFKCINMLVPDPIELLIFV